MKEQDRPTVIEIVPGGRYAIVFPRVLRNVEVERMSARLRRWQDGEEQFLVLGYPGVRIVRIDETEDDD
jgi:hypothetical protein